MKRFLFILILILSFTVAAAFFIACGDDDDDDGPPPFFIPQGDDDENGGSFSDDDSSGDDDDGGCPFADEFTWLYISCEVVMTDQDGNEMSLAEVIVDCNTCIGECSFAYIDDDDCEAAITCIMDMCF